MALIFHAPANLEGVVTPSNISIDSLIEILNSGISASGSAGFVINSSDSEDQIIDLSISGPQFEREILSENTIGVNLKINDNYLCIYYMSDLDPLQFYEAASGDDSYLIKNIVPGPVWGWMNRLNEELSSTKIIVVNIGDDETDFRLCLVREMYYGQCMLHSSLLGEISEFTDHLSLLFDHIEDALDNWSDKD
jgi:hypothetical protein